VVALSTRRYEPRESPEQGQKGDRQGTGWVGRIWRVQDWYRRVQGGSGRVGRVRGRYREGKEGTGRVQGGYREGTGRVQRVQVGY